MLIEGEVGAEETTHASRQEAFRAKAKAKGGKGGPKNAAPVVKRLPRPAAAATKEEAPKVEGTGGDKAEKKEKKVKVAVPGKKAAYLIANALRQKRKTEDKVREGEDQPKKKGKKSA